MAGAGAAVVVVVGVAVAGNLKREAWARMDPRVRSWQKCEATDFVRRRNQRQDADNAVRRPYQKEVARNLVGRRQWRLGCGAFQETEQVAVRRQNES